MSANNSSSSNATNAAAYDAFFDISIKIDIGFRCSAVFIHFLFLVVLIFSPSLHKKTFLFANHATLVNSFYALSMFSYIWNDHPSFPSATLNDILCSISEIAWIFSSYIRAYSMLLLAIYRYLATFKINWFKKLNESNLYLWSLIVLVWLLSFALPLISKYSLGTRSSFVFCLDGWSTSSLNMIIYSIYTNITLILIPTICVIVIYVKISRKLNNLAANTSNNKEANDQSATTRSLRSNATGSSQHLSLIHISQGIVR